MIKALLVCFILGGVTALYGQKQLVLLKREKVVLRLYPGDEIAFRQKNSRIIKRSYVNNLFDTALVTHRDTIPFHTIDRIYFVQKKFYNTLGTLLVIGGAGFFLIDQINHNNDDVDSHFTTVTLSALAVGLPMMLIKKKSQHMGPKYRLLTADKQSVFYLPDRSSFLTPTQVN